jgi:excisionase family DNA binding protein
VPDEFLTIAEVAEMLRLNQQTVRNMIDRGEMGAVRVGQRRVRVRQSQLDAFLAAGEMITSPASQPRPVSTRTLGEESGKQQMRWRPPSTRRIGMPLSRRCPPWRALLAGYSRVTNVRALPRTESDRGRASA